jgi:predicted enzyme related to lactoylglutathione lyase
MANPFVHVELNTPDLKQAQAFYGEMFGWQFNDMDMGPNGIYSTFMPDKGPGGGMVSMAGRPPAWLTYIGVDDIDEATEKAKSLGANVTMDVTEIPGTGWMSVMFDPTGAPVALFEPMRREEK